MSAAAADRKAPTQPTNLRITASSATSVSLAWNPSTDNSGNWWYLVNGSFRVNPAQTTFTRPMLWPNTTYTFTVIAIDQAGNRSPASNAVTHTTPPDTTPPTAPVLSSTLVRPNRAQGRQRLRQPLGPEQRLHRPDLLTPGGGSAVTAT